MKKPSLKTRKAMLDYHECAEFIGEKLNADIRDYAGKHTDGVKDAPYQDFWHFICDTQEINNPCTIFISKDMDCDEDWQQEIVDAFVEEFGDDAEYWVEW